MAAALVLGFPIRRGTAAVVAVAAAAAAPLVQDFHDHAVGLAFPASVAEVLLLSSELPSHHPFAPFRILSRLEEENDLDSPTAWALFELDHSIYHQCCRGLVHPIC